MPFLRNLFKFDKLFMFSIIFFILSFISGAYARGGGGRGFGGFSRSSEGFSGIIDPSSPSYDSNLLLIILLFVVLVLMVVGYILWKVWDKKKKAKELVRQIEKQDTGWKLEEIEYNVEKTFFKVNEAWVEQNPAIARNYMTDSLYNFRKSQIDGLKLRNHKNIILTLHIKELDVVGVGDYIDDNNDYFWVHIKGSKYDYFIDQRTGSVVAGSRSDLKSFSETWKFVRSPKGWIVDRIDQNALWNIMRMDSFTEGYDFDITQGYLGCENCGGYYMLENGESPDDFDVCQCGGNLMYYDNIDGLLDDQGALDERMRSDVYKYSDNN